MERFEELSYEEQNEIYSMLFPNCSETEIEEEIEKRISNSINR